MEANVNNFTGSNGSELIRISEQNGKQAVSARELYNFLEVKEKFTQWIDRMFEYGFYENVDYQSLSDFSEKPKGGRPLTDFALTLDCGKEISMLQRSEKGKQARQYFINCENEYRNSISLYQNDPFIQLRMNQIQQQQQIQQLEAKVNIIEAKTTTRPDYFSVMGYAVLNKITVGLTLASTIGRKAASICKKNNLPTDEVPDPRFGKVKLYPRNVLEDVFNQTVFA